jgi:predicted O-methyltransferase YrrM
MIFSNAKYYDELTPSDVNLKKFLNYNPVHNSYTIKQNIPERNPNETDRGGWRGYDRVYSKYFKDIRDNDLKVLEIGINEGYGIYAWQNYFKNATIYGIDNDWSSFKITHRNTLKQNHPLFKKARLYNVNSTKEDNWLQFYGKKFDIIIDDGDHHPNSQKQTFLCAWKYLKKGGLYFIEDVGHRYGEDCLKSLSDIILSYKKEFAELNIYYHNNLGLKQVLTNKFYVDKHNIKNTNVNDVEYIIAIRKR